MSLHCMSNSITYYDNRNAYHFPKDINTINTFRFLKVQRTNALCIFAIVHVFWEFWGLSAEVCINWCDVAEDVSEAASRRVSNLSCVNRCRCSNCVIVPDNVPQFPILSALSTHPLAYIADHTWAFNDQKLTISPYRTTSILEAPLPPRARLVTIWIDQHSPNAPYLGSPLPTV